MLTIQDYKAGSPQTQTFTYDALDRLTSGVTAGGSGGTYSLQTYTYNGTTGNPASKAGVNYTYGDANHKHAVTQMGSDSFTYDANGNQITRNVGGHSYTLTYDAENRLVGVSGYLTATFIYDGDGNRVKGTIGGVTTAYVGNYFEWTGSTTTMKKYYYAGTTRVAERTGSGTLNYLLGDHLGSQSITTNTSGTRTGEIRYYPWGTERYTWGTTPTTYHFTGQRLESYINLYWYGSRWFDPALGRFISPDPIVPGTGEGSNPNAVGYLGVSTYSPLIADYHENLLLNQLNGENGAKIQNPNFKLPSVPTSSIAFDRYAYSLNNPIKYVDPSGHFGILAALALITPVGWVAIGVTVVGVGLYFAVPGVRETVTAGIGQAGEVISNGLNALFSRPRSNQAQNRQFDGAVKQLERQLGRVLSPDEVRELHENLHDAEDPGFWDIVEEGLNLFDQGENEGNSEDEEGGDD